MSNLGLYVILAGIPLLLGAWAQMRVSRTFKRYSAVPTANGMTGAQGALEVLRGGGVSGVEVREVPGRLSDHYDPRRRTLNLSPDVGRAATVAALGVAAHEAGHAIQDSRGYWPMRVRSALVPAASIGAQLWFLPVVLGMLLGSLGLVNVGLVLFAAVVVFQLVTLPVEFDASRRAVAALERGGLLTADELTGARRVLSAAALTYIAGFVAAIGQLLYFFIASRN